ncbi:MAG TPA: GNAT family N-acetyltransferase [bacterium]|nr:GNAT family N-acetyltransferase [bacterium]HPN45931.1 GNAT family N-acetyltransferase [bacterium]
MQSLANSTHLLFRRAEPAEYKVLTDISWRAKQIWPYPEEYFEIWREELTISPAYVAANPVYVAVQENRIAGYYALVHNPYYRQIGEVRVESGYWLEHIFVEPEVMYCGIGSGLLNHAVTICRSIPCTRLLVFVDPFARGFYDKIGAQFLYDSPSSIPGRTIPVYQINIPIE